MTTPSYIYHRLVVGYHGCDRSVAEAVLLQGEMLQPSENDYDWLGSGIYFWEHGFHRALEFAKWKQQRGEIEEPMVIGAHIHLGTCFDLTDTEATKTLPLFYEQLEQTFAHDEREMPRNSPGGPSDFDLVRRYLDCAVLNLALAENEEIETVRGVFVEGNQAYPGAGIHLKTHVQIAVREPKNILGFFRPANG